jgi:CBS domain-containing protein
MIKDIIYIIIDIIYIVIYATVIIGSIVVSFPTVGTVIIDMMIESEHRCGRLSRLRSAVIELPAQVRYFDFETDDGGCRGSQSPLRRTTQPQDIQSHSLQRDPILPYHRSDHPQACLNSPDLPRSCTALAQRRAKRMKFVDAILIHISNAHPSSGLQAIRKKIESELSRKRTASTALPFRKKTAKNTAIKGTVAALKPSPALTVPENITVADASQLCAAKRTDCVLVVDDEEGLSGIFTAKDLAYRVITRHSHFDISVLIFSCRSPPPDLTPGTLKSGQS